MKIKTKNEYGQLKSIIVGVTTQGSWPTDDLYFNKMIDASTFKQKLIRGPLSTEVNNITTKELNLLAGILESLGIEVHRPEITKPHWSFSPRDILLTVGDKIIECPTPYTSRRNESSLYKKLKFENLIVLPAPENQHDAMFDAANICKLNDKLLYLVSSTANMAGAELLQSVVGTEFEVVTWSDVYAHSHIDSTLISLNEDTVLLNGNRCTEDNLPNFMQSYNKIFCKDIEEQTFDKFPFASKWIGMNILSIDPETVIVDPYYKKLIALLEEKNYNVLTTPLTHARTIGGGFHCVTNDLVRE